jgi:hypothetical protein
MPVLKSRMAALQKQYGEKEGKKIYFKMEEEGKNKRAQPKTKKKKFKRFKK